MNTYTNIGLVTNEIYFNEWKKKEMKVMDLACGITKPTGC